MLNARIVTSFLTLDRPESDFDSCPDVSAIVGTDETGSLLIERFACSVALTEAEMDRAVSHLFDQYRAYRNDLPEPDHVWSGTDWLRLAADICRPLDVAQLHSLQGYQPDRERFNTN